MEHTMAIGDVLAVWGSRDADGNQRQYVIRKHGEIGTGSCEREGSHLHLVEISDLTSGFTMVTDMYIADVLVIDGVSYRWIGSVPGGFIVAPAS